MIVAKGANVQISFTIYFIRVIWRVVHRLHAHPRSTSVLSLLDRRTKKLTPLTSIVTVSAWEATKNILDSSRVRVTRAAEISAGHGSPLTRALVGQRS